ncbi:MAG: hypothetical protein ACE5FT_05910, partial [Candidatus Nanoarchaeia archaeon]
EPVVLRNGTRCPAAVCTTIASGVTFSFNVTGFTTFSLGENSSLAVFDSNDTRVSSNANEPVHFFANYTNATNIAITEAGTFCNITVDNTAVQTMTFNATSQLYEFNRTFASNASLDWNVTCASPSHGLLFANDTLVVDGPPSVTINQPPSTTFNVSTIVNISADVVDNGAVDTVIANVTKPDSTVVQIILVLSTGNTFNATFNDTSAEGVYTIRYMGNDTKGLVNDTETRTFTISAPVAVTPPAGGGGGRGGGAEPLLREPVVEEPELELEIEEPIPVVDKREEFVEPEIEEVPVQEEAALSFCGNTICEGDESIATCPQDCVVKEIGGELQWLNLLWLLLVLVILFILWRFTRKPKKGVLSSVKKHAVHECVPLHGRYRFEEKPKKPKKTKFKPLHPIKSLKKSWKNSKQRREEAKKRQLREKDYTRRMQGQEQIRQERESERAHKKALKDAEQERQAMLVAEVRKEKEREKQRKERRIKRHEAWLKFKENLFSLTPNVKRMRAERHIAAILKRVPRKIAIPEGVWHVPFKAKVRAKMKKLSSKIESGKLVNTNRELRDLEKALAKFKPKHA